MNPWKCEDWKSFYTDKPGLRTGLRLHFEQRQAAHFSEKIVYRFIDENDI